MVSLRLSPFRMLVLAASEKPMTVGRSLETQSGPCGRLEEDAGHYLVAQECLRLVVLHLLGYIEDVQYLLFGEVLNGY